MEYTQLLALHGFSDTMTIEDLFVQDKRQFDSLIKVFAEECGLTHDKAYYIQERIAEIDELFLKGDGYLGGIYQYPEGNPLVLLGFHTIRKSPLKNLRQIRSELERGNDRLMQFSLLNKPCSFIPEPYAPLTEENLKSLREYGIKRISDLTLEEVWIEAVHYINFGANYGKFYGYLKEKQYQVTTTGQIQFPEEKEQETMPEFEYETINQRIAWLYELGIIDLLMNKCKQDNTYNPSRVANIIQSFTDIKASTLKPALRAMYDLAETGKNDPSNNPNTQLFVQEMKRKFKIDKRD